MTKPTLVGERKANQTDGGPLSPFPAHKTGGRLAKILGMTSEQYLAAFMMENLCVGEYNKAEAKQKAAELDSRRPLVLLGKRVCVAFGYKYAPFTSPHQGVVILPHPSGRCQTWNDSASKDKARAIVREVCGV